MRCEYIIYVINCIDGLLYDITMPDMFFYVKASDPKMVCDWLLLSLKSGKPSL